MIPIPEQNSDFHEDSNYSWRAIDYEVDRGPQVYFQYALLDLGEGSCERVRINAFANAKRALHLQVETLANAFGFKKFNGERFANFHKYLEFCDRCGVVTPRILQKLNRVRNAVEHEYYVPSLAETEDFVDVVELFLAATERYFYQFPVDLEYIYHKKQNTDLPDIINVGLEPFTGELKLVFRRELYGSARDVHVKNDTIILEPSHEEYFEWVKTLINIVFRS